MHHRPCQANPALPFCPGEVIQLLFETLVENCLFEYCSQQQYYKEKLLN